MNARDTSTRGLFGPLVSFDAITRDALNSCLTAWGHKMGPLNRPQFRPGCYHGLRHGDDLVAVVATEQMIGAATCDLSRDDALELARVCAARPDLCRIALRLWREFVFPPVARAWGAGWAISYQDAIEHTGNLYRHDGWARIGWSRSGPDRRSGEAAATGRKKAVWAWALDPADMMLARFVSETLDAPRWAERAAA